MKVRVRAKKNTQTFRAGNPTSEGVPVEFSHSEVGISKFKLNAPKGYSFWFLFGIRNSVESPEEENLEAGAAFRVSDVCPEISVEQEVYNE